MNSTFSKAVIDTVVGSSTLVVIGLTMFWLMPLLHILIGL